MRSLLTAMAVWLVCMMPPLTAQQSAFERWLAAARHHKPAELDAFAREVAAWRTSQLDTLVSELRGRMRDPSLVQYGVEDARSRSQLLQRIAFLHADVAVLHRKQSGYVLPASGTSAQGVADGQSVVVSGGTHHWRVARSVLDLVANAKNDSQVREFYIATAAWLQDWTEYSELQIHLQRALELFPTNPTLLLYKATMHEAFAAPRIQVAVAGVDATGAGSIRRTMDGYENSGFDAKRPVGAPLEELRTAERLLRETLRIAPSVFEAQIRLGRVMANQGKDTDAVQVLADVAARELPKRLAYYAHLFLGHSLSRTDRIDDANRALEKALELYPGAQAASLLLSRNARSVGDRDRSIAFLAVLGPSSTGRSVDPWTDYDRSHYPSADDLIAELRSRWAK